MRIATKLVAGVTTGMLIILAAHGYLTFQRETDELELDRRQEGERLAQLMALTMAREWDTQGEDSALAMVANVSTKDRDVDLRWSAELDTEPLSPEDSKRLADGSPVSVLRSAEGRTFLLSLSRVLAPDGDSPRGVISVEHNMSEERGRLLSSVHSLTTAVVLILILASLIATVLSRRWVTRPANSLLERAAAIGRGELEGAVRLPQGTASEFEELGDALDSMAASLIEIGSKREKEQEKRRATEEQLWHAERLITIGKLAAGIAHELGTPLNVILGHAMMIARDQVQGEDIVKSARSIHRQTERISSVVRQLLGVARRRGAAPCECDVTALCAESLELVRPMAKKAGVDLVLPATPAVTASVDPGLFQQVVTNLLTNAIQAIPQEGWVRVTLDHVVAVPPAPADSQVHVPCLQLRVEDTGVGIRDVERMHIFEPFFTSKDVGVGTGLGLSIVHGIVQQHSGWIDVDSEPGRGATFTVYFPQDPEHDKRK